jgi:hypothetical protein
MCCDSNLIPCDNIPDHEDSLPKRLNQRPWLPLLALVMCWMGVSLLAEEYEGTLTVRATAVWTSSTSIPDYGYEHTAKISENYTREFRVIYDRDGKLEHMIERGPSVAEGLTVSGNGHIQFEGWEPTSWSYGPSDESGSMTGFYHGNFLWLWFKPPFVLKEPPGEIVNAPVFHDELVWEEQALALSFPQTGGGSASGTWTGKLVYSALGVESRGELNVSATGVLTVSYKPEEWEAVIVPPPDFEKWKPIGGVDSYEPGSSVGVTIQLRQKGQKEPAPDMTGYFFVTLENVSRQPGVCVNAPPKDEADDEPDLRFEETDELEILDDDGLQVASNEPGNELSLIINCYDFGAYGRLRAEVLVDDGTWLKAYLESDPGKDYLDIPRDDNGNRIADVWEEENAVSGNLPPTWDEAGSPAGQSTLGDGISLYEKYRGFFVKGNHQRLDPHRKHLFIYDPTGWAQMAATESGGASFVTALDCEVLFIDQNQWTGPGGSGAKKRIVNFNSTEEVRATEQHGLHLRFPFTDSPMYPADYNALLLAKYGTNHTQTVTALGLAFPDLTASRWSSPAGWMAVEIYANLIDKWTRDAALYHTYALPEFALYHDPATTDAERARLDTRARTLRDEYITANSSAYEERNWRIFTAVVTHEIGHGLGIKDLVSPGFFGPTNCVMRYFPWPATRAPNDRFELSARVPWPDVYCHSTTGTQDGIACWKQISITDREGATAAPASLIASTHQHDQRQLTTSNISKSRLQSTALGNTPSLALSTELVWDNPLAGDPLRIAVHLSCPAYQGALAVSQSTGQPLPTNVFKPTVDPDWHEGLFVTLYALSNNTYTPVFDSKEWQGFFRPEVVSASSLGRQPLAHSKEWLVPSAKLKLRPTRYLLHVLWDGDGLVESSALPDDGYISAPTLDFHVTAPTNEMQIASQENRLAFEAYAAGEFRKALDYALQALDREGARHHLQVEGTHMLAANAALKLAEYRTAAIELQKAARDIKGELGEVALALRRIIVPEIVIEPEFRQSSPRRLTIVGLPDQTYEVQSSSDLLTWTTLDRRMTTTNRYQVLAAAGVGERQQFYRVVW